jgi:tetratricopeptide (TPR) repeat protein
MMAGRSTEMDFSKKSFLIIDDFQGMRSMLRDILRGCGANLRAIETAANGKEAIDQLGRGKFDVVLCDFNLGIGKNGQQILEEAKFRELIGPACAWIMITAEKTLDVVTGTAEYQPDSYLIKPITEATLRMRLAKIWAKKEAFAEIDAALARHDHARAIRLCDARMAVDKANASDLQRFKCQLLFASGDLDAASQAFAEVLALRDTPWAKLGMAKVLYRKGDFVGAKKLLEEVVGDNSTLLEAYDWLAKALQATGEAEAAEQILERAARLSPNSVLRQKALGDIALKRGNLDNAERAFRKSVSLGEHSVLKTPDAYLGLAKTCSAKQSPEEALRVLGSLNKTFDSDDVRLKSLAVEGQVHHQSGNLTLANKAAKELGERMVASHVRPDSETTMEVARLLLATGDRDRAVALLQGEVQNNPDNAALLAEVQGVFDAANMAEEGVKLVESSRQQAVEMMNRGVLLARDGKFEEAVLSMRNARLAMPWNVRVLFNFAHVIVTQMQQRGADPELVAEARATLKAANQLAPGDRRFGLLMGALDKLAASGNSS